MFAVLVAVATVPTPAAPPGTVVAHVPAASRTFIGSPSLAILPDGTYLASHDLFGPGSGEWVRAETRVFRSDDRGVTWSRLATVAPAFWSGLFVHRGAVYLMGTTGHHGLIAIRRSDDGGRTWTSPESAATGLLTGSGQWHTAPVPVLVHGDRIWRGFEDASGGREWGARYRATMLSAPVDADLLDRGSWTFATPLGRDPTWIAGRFHGWLEGNAVADANGRVLDVLRVDATGNEFAAIVAVSDDGRRATFDPATGFVHFPGGTKKFTIRRDPRPESAGGRPVWWTLASAVAPVDVDRGHPVAIRNTLVLCRSENLRRWTIRSVVLHHPDVARHGFQYVDWQFDGNDIVAVSRTAAEDGEGGPPRAHDANYLTFHRFGRFRDLTGADSVVDPARLGWSDVTR